MGKPSAVFWKDRGGVCYRYMHILHGEGNSKEGGKAVKPLVTKNYKTHMGYVDLNNKMVNGYSISKRMWKWARKFFLQLLDVTVLNSNIVYKPCGGT